MDKIFLSGSPHFIERKLNDALLPFRQNNALIESFFADEMQPSDFLTYLHSIDLFGNEKVAVLRNINRVKLSSKFEDFFANISNSESSHLIIIGDISKAKSKKETVSITEKLLKDNGFKVIKEEASQKVSAGDIISIFSTYGISLYPQQAEGILAYAMNNLSIANEEAKKLSLFSGGDKAKEQEGIRYILGEKQESIFSLVDNFSYRDKKKVLEIYTTIPKSSENLSLIFFSLATRIKQIFLSFIDDNDAKFLQCKFDFQLNIIKRSKQKWKRHEIQKSLSNCANLDKAIKTGEISLQNAVELLLFNG